VALEDEAASLALLVSHVQGRRVRHPSPREGLVTLPRARRRFGRMRSRSARRACSHHDRTWRAWRSRSEMSKYAAIKTAAPATHCRSNPISGRHLLRREFKCPPETVGDFASELGELGMWRQPTISKNRRLAGAYAIHDPTISGWNDRFAPEPALRRKIARHGRGQPTGHASRFEKLRMRKLRGASAHPSITRHHYIRAGHRR
jgi:hypothetical protein